MHDYFYLKTYSHLYDVIYWNIPIKIIKFENVCGFYWIPDFVLYLNLRNILPKFIHFES